MARHVYTLGTLESMVRHIIEKIQFTWTTEEYIEVYLDVCKLTQSISDILAPTRLEKRYSLSPGSLFDLIHQWGRQIEYATYKLGNGYDEQKQIEYITSIDTLDQHIVSTIDQRNTTPPETPRRIPHTPNSFFVSKCLAHRITEMWYTRSIGALRTTDDDLYSMHLQLQRLRKTMNPRTAYL
jgi:hypothetical protein